MKIFKLENEIYFEIAQIRALPILTADILTNFLGKTEVADQFETLPEFQERLEN